MKSKVVIVVIVLICFGLLLSAGISGYIISDEADYNIDSGEPGKTKLGIIIEDPKPECTEVIESYDYLQPVETEKCMPVTTTKEICNYHDLAYVKTDSCYWDDNVLVSSCIFRNLDTETGDFVVELGIKDQDGNILSENHTITIRPDESKEITFQMPVDMGKCVCNIITVPYKLVCANVVSTEEKCYTLTNFEVTSKERRIMKCD